MEASYKKHLNFNPCQTPSPLQPNWLWKDYLLSGFDRPNHPHVDLFDLFPGCSLDQALKAVYPELSLSEVARLRSCFTHNQESHGNEWGDFSQVLRIYGLNSNEDLLAILDLLHCLPVPFQNWVSQKQVAARDLISLLALNQQSTTLIELCEIFVRFGFSKSEGTQWLEWAADLIAAGQSLSTIKNLQAQSPAQALATMQTLRFPHTTAFETAAREKVRKQAWPPRVQARWQRRGDRSLITTQWESSSVQEFLEQLGKVTQIATALNTESNNPWILPTTQNEGGE